MEKIKVLCALTYLLFIKAASAEWQTPPKQNEEFKHLKDAVHLASKILHHRYHHLYTFFPVCSCAPDPHDKEVRAWINDVSKECKKRKSAWRRDKEEHIFCKALWHQKSREKALEELRYLDCCNLEIDYDLRGIFHKDGSIKKLSSAIMWAGSIYGSHKYCIEKENTSPSYDTREIRAHEEIILSFFERIDDACVSTKDKDESMQRGCDGIQKLIDEIKKKKEINSKF